jgi:hypothetical protein
MTPEERTMLAGLFERLRDASSQPREADAERFIVEQVRQHPYAPYYMAQAVLVQEQALAASSQRIQDLETRVQELEAGQSRAPAGGGAGSGSFLGGLWSGGSRGASQPAQAAPAQRAAGSVPATGQSAPWSRQPMAQVQPQPAQGGMFGGGGGGFLKGALATAAGVAGGALLYDSLKGAFGGGSQTAQAPQAAQPAATETAQAADTDMTGDIDQDIADADYDQGDWDSGDIEI